MDAAFNIPEPEDLVKEENIPHSVQNIKEEIKKIRAKYGNTVAAAALKEVEEVISKFERIAFESEHKIEAKQPKIIDKYKVSIWCLCSNREM
jgi:predicted nucleic acid-binding protein